MVRILIGMLTAMIAITEEMLKVVNEELASQPFDNYNSRIRNLLGGIKAAQADLVTCLRVGDLPEPGKDVLEAETLIEAVKLYRAQSGCGLKEGKDKVLSSGWKWPGERFPRDLVALVVHTGLARALDDSIKFTRVIVQKAADPAVDTKTLERVYEASNTQGHGPSMSPGDVVFFPSLQATWKCIGSSWDRMSDNAISEIMSLPRYYGAYRGECNSLIATA